MVVYAEKDLLPLTLRVLNIIVANYACNTYKYMIQMNCPDIKELVVTDELDISSLELLLSVADQPVKAACNSLRAIHDAANSLINIFGLNRQGVSDDPFIAELSIHFYQQVIIDEFPTDQEQIKPSLLEYKTFLASFSTSTIELIGCLCTILALGEIDLESIWEPGNNFLTFVNQDYGNHQNAIALDLLQQLGIYLFSQLQI